MTTLLVFKEHLKRFYSRFEAYIVPVLKFLAAYIALSMINRELGYMARLGNKAIMLIAALMCSFLPMNLIVVIAAAFSLGHIYTLSWECMIVILIMYLLMFFLYFRFTPKDTVAVLLTPVCFVLRIPALMPISLGLVGTPVSVVSVGCGAAVYYVLHFISRNASAINALEADGALVRFRFLLDGIIQHKMMLTAIVAAAVAVIVVYFIRRIPVAHNWTFAMISGAFLYMIVLMLGDLKFRTEISVPGTIIGGIFAVGIAKILQFFVFNVDYSRTENIQFEDDEYYYYVKAVPKMSVTLPDKTVTKIDTRKPAASVRDEEEDDLPPGRSQRPAVSSASGQNAQRTSPAAGRPGAVRTNSNSAPNARGQVRTDARPASSGAGNIRTGQTVRENNSAGGAARGRDYRGK